MILHALLRGDHDGRAAQAAVGLDGIAFGQSIEGWVQCDEGHDPVVLDRVVF